MRGAVSVALVYYYYDSEDDATNRDHATLISLCWTSCSAPMVRLQSGLARILLHTLHACSA